MNPQQQMLASPVDEQSPRTPPGVMHQPVSHESSSAWVAQLQSPVGYPPTPSPQLPSSPSKNPYVVHPQMHMQQQPSPLPMSPSGPVGPRFGSPTQSNGMIAMK